MALGLLMIVGGTVLLLLFLGLAWRLLSDPPLDGDAWAMSIFLVLFSFTLGGGLIGKVAEIVSFTIPRRDIFDLVCLAPLPLGLAVFMGWNSWIGFSTGQVEQRSRGGSRYVIRRSSQPFSFWGTLMFAGGVSLGGAAAFLFLVFALVRQV